MEKVNTTKNEEYEITDLIYNYQIEGLTKERRAYILRHNAKIFAKRKSDFYKTMRKYGYPISNETTRQLMELGEINLNQAVELEFYCSLNNQDKMMYYQQCLNDYVDNIEKYLEKCYDLNRYLLKMKHCAFLSRSYLEQAQQYSLPEHLEYGDILLDIASPVILWNEKMRQSNVYFKTWKEIEESYRWNNWETLKMAREDLKKLSKSIFTQVNNLRNFQIVDGLGDDFLIYDTLISVRSALSNDAKQMLRKNTQMQKKHIRASEAEKNRFL